MIGKSRIRRPVRERPVGTSVLESLRASSLAYCDQLAAERPGFDGDGFIAMVESSAALAKRWHQFRNQQGDAVAAALLGAQRAVMRAGRLRLAAGHSPAEIAGWLRPQVDRIFDQLAHGIAGYPS